MKRRLLAFLLALSMMFSLVPVNAFAVGTAEAGNTAPSEVAETEAAAETPVAEYAAQVEPAVTVGFTRYEESPANLGVGDQFGDAFTFAVSEDVSFEAFEATFRYDPTVAMFGLFSPTEFDVEPNHETGVLTIRDANKTFAAGQSYSYVLLFAGAQLGDATVTLESFKIDGKELLSKSIDAVQTVGYNVSWAENAAYTITGEKYAPVGGSYTFTVDVSDGYDAANMVVKANGEEVTGTGNQYTVDPVSSDLTITVEGVEKEKDILSDIGFVRAEGSAEKVPMDVGCFATTWTFTLNSDLIEKSLWATFQYNPATTEFFYIRDPGLGVEDDTENGILRIGGDNGWVNAADFEFEIAFRPKAFGDATVTLKSFEADGKDYLSAPISVATTVCCSVSWDEDATYTVTGEKLVEAGKDYTFTVAANEGYDASNAVVKVNGAEVTAVDGKYTVENVASDLTITVEGVTEAVKQSGLSVLKFGDTSTESKAQMFELSPAFDPAVKEYTVLVPDNANMFYAWATQAADRSSSTTITAKWVNLNVDTAKTQKLTSGKAGGQNLAGFAPTGVKVNTMTIEVVDGDFKDEYKLTSVRVAPSLTALSLDGIRLAESFSATKMAYTATTAAESVTVAATPRDESYTVTINGGSETTVPLNLGENEIKIVVTNPGGYTNTYTVTVTRVASVEAVFNVDPADAKVIVWDANKDRVVPTDGKYSVMSGTEYTYLVQRDGYVSQKSSFTFTESGSIIVTLVQATENPSLDKSIRAEWGNFRKGDNNLGITDARTPYAPEDAELLWAVKHGTGWSAAPGSPIMVDGDIYTYSGSTIRRINSMTGETVTEGTMVGSSSFSIVPMTYGDGMVFVGLSSGRIQAFNAKTLESLWVYTDELGGQPNCPITYKDGYIYAGFWNSEDRNANFACINTIDEDHASTTEAKYASWTYTRQGGFYWAGAYVTDKLAIVGTDDGAGGYDTNGAALLVFDRYTGALIDSHEGIRGDLRSNISHDPESDRVFFTTKGGILGNAQIDWDTGKILDYKEVVIKDAQGNANAMSTCTPSVYNGRIYIGVAGTSQFGANSGHGIAVYTLNGDGSMTQAYVYPIIGYPQTSAMVSTAYSAEDGYVYIYLPYNYTPGGISVLKDRPGQTAPITTTGEGYSEVFTPVGTLAQYCICSTIADQYGTIYYKNDSCYMMAITSKIESLEITQEPTITENEDGTLTVDGLKAVTKLRNGLERDVSNYVSVTKNEQTGGYTVSYTYGFDNDSYGLKTVTAEITNGYTVTIPEDDGYTVTGEKTVKDGENYTFTVTVAEGYDGSNMVVKVNGTEVTAVDGKYTVENVSSDLTITVEGVVKAAVNGLSALRFGSTGTNSSAKIFTLSPAFDPAVKEYTLLVPDSTNAVYAWATRGADLTTKATIKATWTSMSTGKAANSTITSGSSSGRNLSGFNIASAESNTLTITVTEGDVTDVYTVKTVRIDPSLTKLALDGVKINESFSATKKTYTAITTKDSVTVLATPRGESYTVTYNGETSNVVPLTNGENKIEIVVTNKDGYTNSYTLTVTKAEHSVTIPTDESYLVTGKEAVVDGDDYTFKVEIDYRYEATEDFAVKVNGEVVTAEDGKYTVKNVTTDLVITVEGVTKKILKPVTVYFSFSHDEQFQFCDQSGQVVALKEITVPYFDLALYGLEDFYFASEDYGPASGDPTGGPGSALDPGTKEFAYGKITMLHLFLYATEVYYLGVDPADAGKGYMRDQIGSDTLSFSGSAGSIYMTQIWGYDENLNYYLNYAYPLASAGWGSTSDQILLHDGDIVTLGHFSDWSFYNDSGAVFNHIETDITDPIQGDKVKMTIYRDGADFGGTYNTAHTVRTNCPSVYCTPADSVTTGDVTKWKYVGTAEADGTLVVDTSSLAPGEYIFSIPGQYGNENESAIVGAPGGIRMTIREKTVTVIKGDINGDGVINAFDVTELYNAVSSGKELDTALADINGDGVVNALDVAALFALIQSGN